MFWGTFLGNQFVPIIYKEVLTMRKKNYKGRCEKRTLSKANEIIRTYDAIQSVYANILQADTNIKEIQCNVNLDGLTIGE